MNEIPSDLTPENSTESVPGSVLESTFSPTEARRRRIPIRRRPRPIQIDIYDGYGTTEHVAVIGRLYTDRKSDEVQESDSRIKNLVKTSRRFIANEAEYVWVKVDLNGDVRETQTDYEGVFRVAYDQSESLIPGLHQVRVSLSNRNKRKLWAETSVGHYIVHAPNNTHIGLISDIDDTLVYSGATSKMRLLRTIFLSNYKTQLAVEGMSAIYRLLLHGPQGDGFEAAHYVSSSPDNLYGRIRHFLSHHQFPYGSIDLKNLGLRKGSDSLFSHESYKLGKIRKIFETYPTRHYVLFGDSGEHDPEIYRQISKEFPGRVAAIYIHNVSEEDAYSSRFEGQLLFTSLEKVRRDLVQRGLIVAQSANVEPKQNATD